MQLMQVSRQSAIAKWLELAAIAARIVLKRAYYFYFHAS